MFLKPFNGRLAAKFAKYAKMTSQKVFQTKLEAENFYAQYLKMKNYTVPFEVWTKKNFLVETFAQLSQQIRRFW